jgi:hypothetical protein
MREYAWNTTGLDWESETHERIARMVDREVQTLPADASGIVVLPCGVSVCLLPLTQGIG